MNPDPWYKRSSFASLLWIIGVGVIYFLAEGREPSTQEYIEAFGLLMTVLGYTKFRPTAKLPPA